jgi:hypothetical protein
MRKDYPEVAELAQKVLKKLSPKKSGKKQTKK